MREIWEKTANVAGSVYLPLEAEECPALRPSPVLARVHSGKFSRASSHLLHMSHRHALEKEQETSVKL